MKLSQSVKPISYLKAHASEVLRRVAEDGETVVITHNGSAKAILQDLRSYEQMQESLALLKILAQSKQGVRAGRIKPVATTFRSIRKRVRDARTG